MKHRNELILLISVVLLFSVFTSCQSISDLPQATEHQHTYGEWKIESGATCIEPGVKYRVCSICKDKQSEKFAATSHDFQNHICNLCATEANAYWYDENESEFLVGTIEDLRGIAELVNNGTDFEGKTITLSNDIDLLSRPWIPIGTKDNPFKGTFDGNGKTLTRLTTDGNVDYEYTGLFGVNAGTVKNLNISNSTIRLAAGKYVGCVAGLCIGGNVTNVCISESKLNLVGDKDSYIGGLVGAATDNSTIENCCIIGGTLEIQSAKANMGGLVGMCDSSKLSRSYIDTEQKISATVASYGGLVGYNVNGAISYCYVQNNINWVIRIADFGGLVGHNKDSTIEESYSRADISNNRNYTVITGTVDTSDAVLRPAKKYVGMLVGQNENSTINSCFTRGEAFLTSSETIFGSIIAVADDSKVTNCYYSGHLSVRGEVTETKGIGEETTGSLIRENIMGWSEDIWNFDTPMPTLK